MVFSLAIYAQYKDADVYCPVLINTKWVYTVYPKKSSKKPYDRVTEITGTETYDKLVYFTYFTPESDTKFLMRKDDNGVYLKVARYAVPFLSFIKFDVVFEPPVYAVRFPFKKGDSWKYEGIASLKTLGIFNFPTKVSATAAHMGPEVIEAVGRSVNAYKIYAEMDREGEKTFKASFWFGEGVGLAKYESDNIVLGLTSFEVKADAGVLKAKNRKALPRFFSRAGKDIKPED